MRNKQVSNCYSKWLIGLMIVVFSTISGLVQAAYNYAPANPKANAQTVAVLKAFQNAADSGKMIIGQHVHSYVWAWRDTEWKAYIEDLKAKTGEYPAFVGIDYNAGGNAPEKDPANSRTHDIIKQFAGKGGVVSISQHMINPWTGGSAKDTQKSKNLLDLITPGNSAYKNFHAQLDRMLAGVLDLKKSNVVVILRPFHEMNGAWFWWHDQSAPTGKNFIKLWRYTFNYFNARGADNVLWMWAASGAPLKWIDAPMDFYPGADYVDLVGVDQYPESLDNSGYPEHYQNLYDTGKVFGFGEFGFNKSQDLRNLLNQAARYPKTGFAMLWNAGWAIKASPNADRFMRDPRLVNMNGFKNMTAATNPPHPPGQISGALTVSNP